MSNVRPLSELKELQPVADLATSLKAQGSAGADAGVALAKTAAEFGLSTRDYIILSGSKQADHSDGGLDAYEQLLVELNLPIRDNYKAGISMQAASETFHTYEGTRALFPEVIDDVIRFANRQDMIETVEPMIASSRTITGNEMISTVVDDDSADRKTNVIAEGANIPVQSIRTSETAVKIYKHGSGIRTTYEFNRRASLNLLVPYGNRIARELEISKVRVATNILINGDGVNAAAPEVNQSTYNTAVGTNATAGEISWKHFLKWLIKRAQDGTPVDTVIMNYDAWFQWSQMFSTQSANAGLTQAEALARSGVSLDNMPATVNMLMNITPVLSSQCPTNKLIGMTRGETLEELVEAGSDIQETERAIRNQTVTVVKTQNSGYKIVFGDTREIFNFGA